MRKPRDKRAIAEDVWRLMAGFTTAKFQTGERLTILRELGLTPGHLKALAVLDPDQPRSMRAMADSLACDASMVTWLVDRLEEQGLVQRETLSSDRRVKTLVLTPLGIETRARAGKALFEPPEDLLKLDASALTALRDALLKLPPPTRPFWTGGPPVPHDRTGSPR